MIDHTGKILLKICKLAEVIMSIVLIIVISVEGFRMIAEGTALITADPMQMVDLYIGNIMILAVGVEFVKMLLLHSPSAVIEVLMFAVARQLAVGHGDYKDLLIGILALAVLFAIKFFFVEGKTIQRTNNTKTE